MQDTPETRDELLARLYAYAKHGAAALEGEIRRFNNHVANHIAPRAILRENERASYIDRRVSELEAEERAAKLRAWAATAGAEYDAERPPIHVPERVDPIVVAKEIVAQAKRGKAA